MQHRPTMAMGQPMHDLQEYWARSLFVQLFVLLDILEQIAGVDVLHHQEEVILRLEHLIETNDVRVADLFQDVDLLHDFLLAELILHMLLVNGLDRHIAPRKLVDAKRHLAKRSFANKLHELIELE